MSTRRTFGRAGRRVDHLGERDRDEVAALHRDHRAVAAGEQVLRGAVAEVARVLHVERDRIGAAQLVADVLRGDRRLDLELLQPLAAPAPSGCRRDRPRRCAGGRGVALDVLQARRDPPRPCRARRPSAITATPSRRPSLSRLMIAPVSVSTIVLRRIGAHELLGDERERGARRPCRCRARGARPCGPSRRRSTSARSSWRRPSGS